MIFKKLTPAEWRVLSENAHRAAFGEQKPASWDRIAFAILAIDEQTDTPLAYVTCQELDAHSAYIQHGGSFPGARDTILSYRAFEGFLSFLKKTYDRVSLRVENKNSPMLKFAMKAGFLIIGLRVFDGSIFLEHLLEFKEG